MLTSFHSIKSRYTAPVRLRFFGELLTSLTGAMMGPFMVLYLHEQLNGSIMMPMLIISLQPFADIFLTLAARKGGGPDWAAHSDFDRIASSISGNDRVYIC